MKRLLLLFISIITVTILYGITSTVTKPIGNANYILLPVGKTDKKISLMELSRISIKDLQGLTGRNMNFFDRLQFKIVQKKLRNSINDGGSFSKKKIRKYFENVNKGFDAGGFFLGLLLSWLGVLMAYLFQDDKKRNRVKWAWIGFGVSAVFFIIVIIGFAGITF